MNSLTMHIFLAVLNVAVACGILLAWHAGFKRLLWIISPVVWTLQLVNHFSHAGFYSLSGIIPTCAIASVVLGLCQCTSLTKDNGTKRPFYSAVWLLLLALFSLIPDGVSHDSFMMTYIFAILFFLFRPLCLGFVLYSLAGMVHVLSTEEVDVRIVKTSKDAAFMASILFLGGEIIGCYWGFIGWGTTWRWSGNFQFSAMLFILFMVSLHVPAKLFHSWRGNNLTFSLPLLCIALCLILTKVI